MTKCKISEHSYQVEGKWVASGTLIIDQGWIQRDVSLGPSEQKFDTEEEANKYLFVLAKNREPAAFRICINRI